MTYNINPLTNMVRVVGVIILSLTTLRSINTSALAAPEAAPTNSTVSGSLNEETLPTVSPAEAQVEKALGRATLRSITAGNLTGKRLLETEHEVFGGTARCIVEYNGADGKHTPTFFSYSPVDPDAYYAPKEVITAILKRHNPDNLKLRKNFRPNGTSCDWMSEDGEILISYLANESGTGLTPWEWSITVLGSKCEVANNQPTNDEPSNIEAVPEPVQVPSKEYPVIKTPAAIKADYYETLVVKGVTYNNVKITRTEPDGVVVSHSKGIAKFLFSELPAQVSKQHEVPLPWYIAPSDAARYWPNSINQILTILEPEVIKAKAQHAIAVSNLNSLAYWHAKYGSQYAFVDNKLLRTGDDIAQLEGRILSVIDESIILIFDRSGEVFACSMPKTDDLVDGEDISLLGKPDGVYRYTATSKAIKQVRLFEFVPSISWEEFSQLGKESFPEISNKLAQAEISASNAVLNAGQKTYTRLLADRVEAEKRRAHQREIIAEQKASELRQKQYAQEIEEQRAKDERAAQEERKRQRYDELYKMK